MNQEKKSKRRLPSLRQVVLLLILGALIFIGYKVNNWVQWRKEYQVEASSQAILDRIEKVSKLITVEGYFSEIYDYKDYYWYDLSPFRKKALIRVKAKVSVGVDLEKMEIHTDSDSKTVRIQNIPAVEILSIDHDADYYDISEGTFNSFSEKDYNELQKNAKDYIRHIALKSDLVETAKVQQEEILEFLRFFVESVGWTLELEEETAPVLQN